MNKLIIVFLVLSIPGLSHAIELRWGINVDPIDYYQKAAQAFKKAVEKRTNGAIKVKLIENEVADLNHHLHSRDTMEGRYDMGQADTSELTSYFPEFNIWGLPYLFKNDDHVKKYLATSHSKKNLAKLDQLGLVPVAHTYSGGFLWIYGDKLNSFSELKEKN